MDATRHYGPKRLLEPGRKIYRRDDEEFETPPRWLGSRLRADLESLDTIAGRFARPVASNSEGGQ